MAYLVKDVCLTMNPVVLESVGWGVQLDQEMRVISVLRCEQNRPYAISTSASMTAVWGNQ